MPNVRFSFSDFEGLIGKNILPDKDKLNDLLAFVKGDVESIEADRVSIEIKDSNRPDIWSVEGICRALRSQLGIGQVKPVRVTAKSRLKVIIDKRLKAIRPYIACAIVKQLTPTDESITSWISLQEKLDLTYGRKRKRSSIGYYDADLIKSPLHYTVTNPSATSFVPLGGDRKMRLKEIVSSHPKGLVYGPIISSFKEWPILHDDEGKILSLPPVINSNDLGKITTETRNILIEVTGTNWETVHNTLKIVVSALYERNGRIHSCIENYQYGPQKTVTTPDLTPDKRTLQLPYASKILGIELGPSRAVKCAKKAGYGVIRSTSKTLELEVPCYRIDIMHPIDIVEDIAVSLDINSFTPEWPKIPTIGALSPQTEQRETLGEIMIGLGFQEVVTYALTSTEIVAEKPMVHDPSLVQLANPKMSTHTTLRNWLLPSLLEFLSHNTHVDYPQKIFEVATCIQRTTTSSEDRADDALKLAATIIHPTAGFTEIRASLDSLSQNLDRRFQIEPAKHPSFLPGRCGSIRYAGREVGILGEINPDVLVSWGLNLPAAAFEVNVDPLLNG
ncbi:MAG TPA: phenylalanine--tRNA ligase subunit beta [Candidatus Bathyarchaeia archaeon]|nr:phenylalanine--tRNA ligase subunit beta [Candidatus Bathyarchaeia archaeon]